MPDAKGRLYADDVAADLDIDPATWRAYVSRGQAPDPDDRVIDGARFRPVWNPATIDEYKGTRGARRDIVEVVWERTVNADFEAGPTRGTPGDPNRYVRRRVTYGPWEPDPDGERYFRELAAQLAAQRAHPAGQEGEADATRPE